MGYNKTHNPIIVQWFEKIKKLESGDEIWLRCNDKSHQASMKTQLYGVRKEYQKTHPVEAEQISFSLSNKVDPVTKTAFWVKCTKKANDPTVGYLKRGGTGKPEEVKIEITTEDPKKEENIKLMIEDGHTLSEIKSIYDLTPEEEALVQSVLNQDEGPPDIGELELMEVNNDT